MDVKTISMPEEEAEKIYKEYLEVVKIRKEKHLEDLKKAYKALKDGKRIIDIYDAFKKTGLTEEGNPKLAIAQADVKTASFHKEAGGAGVFTVGSSRWGWKERVVDVRLPAETFPEWKNEKGEVPHYASDIANRDITTNVPLVPAHLMPPGKLENYYILWEVEEWRPIAKAEDPYLLRRINANTFVVLAEWDLTKVEQIVMRGN